MSYLTLPHAPTGIVEDRAGCRLEASSWIRGFVWIWIIQIMPRPPLQETEDEASPITCNSFGANQKADNPWRLNCSEFLRSRSWSSRMR
jgi:hypothetical protein